MRKNAAAITVLFPPEVLQRAKSLCKAFRISQGQMIREGLIYRIEELEQQQRREMEFKEVKKAAKNSQPLPRFEERTLGSSRLGPRPFITELRRGAEPDGPTGQDPLDAIYKMLAQAMLDAGDDKTEIRRRAEAAVATIKRERPLTCPSDEEILTTLEKYVIKIRNEPSPSTTRTFDTLVDRVINVSKFDSGIETLDQK